MKSGSVVSVPGDEKSQDELVEREGEGEKERRQEGRAACGNVTRQSARRGVAPRSIAAAS